MEDLPVNPELKKKLCLKLIHDILNTLQKIEKEVEGTPSHLIDYHKIWDKMDRVMEYFGGEVLETFYEMGLDVGGHLDRKK